MPRFSTTSVSSDSGSEAPFGVSAAFVLYDVIKHCNCLRSLVAPIKMLMGDY